MAETNPQKLTIMTSLIAAFDVIAGRVKVENAFDFSPATFWQAILASWGFGLFMALPFAQVIVEFIFNESIKVFSNLY